MVIMLWGCKDEFNKTGYGLLLPGDLVLVKIDTTKTVADLKSFTKTDGNLRSDEPAYNLLGTFNDPVFGKTTADFACQFRLGSFPDFSKNAQPDSIMLYLYYMEFYGDTIVPQRLKVYELASNLDVDQKYYQDINLKNLSKGEILADYSYVPKFKLDSLSTSYGSTKEDPKDTVIQQISIKLDLSLARKLMAADSLTLSDNDKFLNYLKGLYIEAGDLNTGGAIMKINTIAQSNTISHGSYLVLHYHNSEEDSLYCSLGITQSSARINRFTHDYTKTKFAANLDKEQNQDSLIYVQTTGGLRSKIFIPNLETWRDSSKIAINQAELIFKVDAVASDTAHYLMPEKLALVAITKSLKTGQDSLYYPSDYAFSPDYFGGTYNKEDLTYRFNIAKHLKDIIDRKKENLGFYFETTYKNSIYRRAVLKGATSKTGIRLEVTYSKMK
jgi:hypothetical protein